MSNGLFDRLTEEVWLFPPRVGEELDALLEQVMDARDAAVEPTGTERAGDEPEWEKLAAQHERKLKAAKKNGVKVVLGEVPETRERAIRDQHPPREGNAGDQRAGFNRDAAVSDLARAMWVEPAWSDEEWQAWRASVPSRHWRKIERAVVGLSEEDFTDLPKQSIASLIRQSTSDA